MARLFASAVVLTSLVLAVPATAQSRFTVQQLRELCASAEVARQNVCNAYVAGVRQTLDVFKNSLKERVRYCIPSAVTNREVKEKFVAWAERNAAAAMRSAVSGLIRSVHDAYPCAKKPGGEQFDF